MRRIERVRFERARQTALVIGMTFSIGALTALGLTWRNDRRVENAAVTAAVATTDGSRKAASAVGPPPAIDTIITGADRDLVMPVDGVDRDDLRDTFAETRGGTRPHEALDIIAPRGTPVRAVRDGHIEKLFTSEAGGLTIYQFDPSSTYAYYYAHLDGYAAGLHDGQAVAQGDVIGYVGSTGNAAPDAPHLHFAIFRLTAERLWSKGEPLDPYPLLR